jgi:ferritin
MINNKVLGALNNQMNHEFHSAYHYLAMESYFRVENLNGFSKWARSQYGEERGHAIRIFDYIHERGCKVTLCLIAEPPQSWDSPLAAIQDSYMEEQRASGMINDLVDVALAERDHATDNFLRWFVERQVDEEAEVGSIVQKLKLVEDDKYGLFLVDRDLA